MNAENVELDDQSLERIVELADNGRELTDEELAWLMQDKEALRVYCEMTSLRNAVGQWAQEDDDSAVDAAWERFAGKPADSNTRRGITRWLWTAGIAASLLVLIGIGWTLRGKQANDGLTAKGYVAFERSDKAEDVLLTRNDGDATVIDGKAAETGTTDDVPMAQTTDGQTVLDYSAIAQQGLAVSTEVERHTVTIPRGKDFRVVLADGTEVWLYADSRLTYPSHFIGKERRVVLHGEAYFKVAHDAAHPFVIHTEALDARVLGTELNVRSYGKDNVHVALINGKVEVGSGKRVTLKPGQGATLNGNGLTVQEENMDVYTYWRSGYIYFDDAPLIDVMQALGRWYNLNVVFENKELTDKQLRFFCLRSEPVRQAVALLNSYGQFTVVQEDNTLYVR